MLHKAILELVLITYLETLGSHNRVRTTMYVRVRAHQPRKIETFIIHRSYEAVLYANKQIRCTVVLSMQCNRNNNGKGKTITYS